MTHSRQQRHKSRSSASLTIISTDAETVFMTRLEDVWAQAKEFWGKDAQAICVTAFSSADPIGHLRDRLPRPPTAA